MINPRKFILPFVLVIVLFSCFAPKKKEPVSITEKNIQKDSAKSSNDQKVSRWYPARDKDTF
ncbi:MAG: hypothetical protein H6581_21370 [Bacteroidia bacterium]|nr:hypothetical protein [Bacteroidia bacterium]